jgi:DNA replication and repair protein RecF
MRLNHLSLTNFRNYVRLDLDLSNAITLLQGDNAEGKTNLLEAIYYLATASSPRARTDRELINWLANEEQMPFARLEAEVEEGDTPRQVSIALVRTPNRLQKEIRINGVKRRALDLIGQVKAVLFMPEDIDLIAGSPDARRRYLDASISQIDRRYYQSLQVYDRVLRQRNSLLRRLRERHRDPHQLDFWDQRLTGEGSKLIARRLEVVAELNRLIQDIHPKLTGGTERLRLLYRSTLPMAEDAALEAKYQLPLQIPGSAPTAAQAEALSPSQIKTLFQQRLEAHRGEEIERGMTLTGPHRDDVRFLVGGVDMCVYGSRGQQRTIAISLKLAEVELIRSETQQEPILLLDDVMSELDEERRRYLMDVINGEQQVIITSTDLDPFAPPFLKQATVWRIDGGRVQQLSP